MIEPKRWAEHIENWYTEIYTPFGIQRMWEKRDAQFTHSLSLIHRNQSILSLCIQFRDFPSLIKITWSEIFIELIFPTSYVAYFHTRIRLKIGNIQPCVSMNSQCQWISTNSSDKQPTVRFLQELHSPFSPFYGIIISHVFTRHQWQATEWWKTISQQFIRPS